MVSPTPKNLRERSLPSIPHRSDQHEADDHIRRMVMRRQDAAAIRAAATAKGMKTTLEEVFRVAL